MTRRYELTVQSLQGESWWGGNVADGTLMPFDEQTELARDLEGDARENQAQPLLVSSHGRFVAAEAPFSFTLRGGVLSLLGRRDPLTLAQAGHTLRGALAGAARACFELTGRTPDPRLFRRPIYNTWIELMYEQNEAAILDYAGSLLAHGLPSGVLMIDDGWQEDYGSWEFCRRRFRDPRGMVDKLKRLGFHVMLWVCPFISADSLVYRQLRARGLLLRELEGDEPAIVRWWNGASALLDLTHPDARTWLRAALSRLVADYGVDGFKLDGGDPHFYRALRAHEGKAGPNDHTEAWCRIGLDYPLNEYRASWRMGGQPLAQRLRDKSPSWEALATLVPEMLALGLLGYSYGCADMIGGGQYLDFIDREGTVDQELFVRWAQCQALMPLMQFSLAPWRVLDELHLAACRDAVGLHVRHAPVVEKLAIEAARTGTPIVRPLEYAFPHQGYAHVHDQFMLGDDLLVAPVLASGQRERSVCFPVGRWKGGEGRTVEGPALADVAAPLDSLPFFERV